MKRTYFFGNKWFGVESTHAILKNGSDDQLFFEQFNALRAKFEFQVDRHHYRVVAITSSIAGEGKTISSANLAINLASNGMKKVLLIDADLRKSDLSRALDVEARPGLSEYLTGKASLQETVRKTGVKGLYVIPGGERLKAPMDHLSGDRFRELITMARDKFDNVLLDTPPIIPVADTLSLKDKVDGFIFLFRVQFTPHGLLKQAVDEVGNKNVIGVVLNGVDRKREKYYARYYGKYYRKNVSEKHSK